MFKKTFILSMMLVLPLVCGVTPSQAEFYISAHGMSTFIDESDIETGSNTYQITYKQGYGFSGAVGSWVDFDTPGRIEIEGSYRTNDVDDTTWTPPSIKASIESVSVMLNAYADYDVRSFFKPFVGLGVGMAEITLDLGPFGSAADTVAAGQIILGCEVPLNDHFSIEAQYRFFGTPHPKLKSNQAGDPGYESEYLTHNTLVGLRYAF